MDSCEGAGVILIAPVSFCRTGVKIARHVGYAAAGRKHAAAQLHVHGPAEFGELLLDVGERIA
jgi:hypothetical protein